VVYYTAVVHDWPGTGTDFALPGTCSATPAYSACFDAAGLDNGSASNTFAPAATRSRSVVGGAACSLSPKGFATRS
jgi:hypothetical protein